MTNRDKGDRYEYKTRDILVGEGYHVTRSAGSLGMFDFIAIPPDNRPLRLIQVKSFKPNKEKKRLKPYHTAEKNLIRSVNVPPYAQKEFWVWWFMKPEPVIEYL